MRRLLLILVAASIMVGCNPVPYKQSCHMPAIGKSSSVTVQESFDTSGYFKVRCRTAAPKRITVAGSSATLNILVEGRWFRLEAQAKDGTPLEVRGPFVLRGRDARIDRQPDNVLQVEAVTGSGTKIESFTVPYSLEECTCVSYDAI
jgi:hypothetical protein